MADDQLEGLNALVGEWITEATHPIYPETVVYGRARIEWLEGRRFLIYRSWAEHPEFPDGISIIGAVDDDALSMFYFDSRGVHRVYRVSLDDGVWRIWRDHPGFSQRFEGHFAEDGEALSGTWQVSRDDVTWDDDLEITFKRAG